MSAKKNETTLNEDDVRKEHEKTARPAPHWAYLFGVLGAGFIAMLGLIALLGASG
jgi:uncharacterized membrane protein YdcZ (DUF606 family)